ncbi:hypothetical protein TWF173_003525 [Orbilia oligospora]|nr:hypothetical protein TWF173_003525 [Orbilia oligospora]
MNILWKKWKPETGKKKGESVKQTTKLSGIDRGMLFRKDFSAITATEVYNGDKRKRVQTKKTRKVRTKKKGKGQKKISKGPKRKPKKPMPPPYLPHPSKWKPRL